MGLHLIEARVGLAKLARIIRHLFDCRTSLDGVSLLPQFSNWIFLTG